MFSTDACLKRNNMKTFLTYTSIIEIFTGLGLLCMPVPIIGLLFGSPLNGEDGVIVSRIAGTAILAFAGLCYFLKTDGSAWRVTTALLLYNFLLSLIFGYGIGMHQLMGGGAWLVLLFHSFQTFTAIYILQKKSTNR
jgi:hypothetical protein